MPISPKTLSASGSTCSGDTVAPRSALAPRIPSTFDACRRRPSALTAEKCARRRSQSSNATLRQQGFVEIGVRHRAGVEHHPLGARHPEVGTVELVVAEPHVAQSRLRDDEPRHPAVLQLDAQPRRLGEHRARQLAAHEPHVGEHTMIELGAGELDVAQLASCNSHVSCDHAMEIRADHQLVGPHVLVGEAAPRRLVERRRQLRRRRARRRHSSSITRHRQTSRTRTG